MITNIILILWVLFLIAVPLLSIINLKSGKLFKFIDFEKIEIPYVTIDIQGYKLNMVVDTGCSVSLLSVPAIADYKIDYVESGKSVDLSAITSDKVTSNAVTITFEVFGKEVTEDFYLQDVEDFGNFQKMHGVVLHGLLGSSFFDANKCKIDFKNHCLIM